MAESNGWGGGAALFEQLNHLIKQRIRAAEGCLQSRQIITNDAEYRGKIEGLRDCLRDLDTMERLWVGSGEEL